MPFGGTKQDHVEFMFLMEITFLHPGEIERWSSAFVLGVKMGRAVVEFKPQKGQAMMAQTIPWECSRQTGRVYKINMRPLATHTQKEHMEHTEHLLAQSTGVMCSAM